MRLTAALAAAALAAAFGGCVAPRPESPGGLGMGPLAIRQGSPFEFTRADTVPRAPGRLGAGELELGGFVTWTSRWANTDGDAYVGDGEAIWLTTVVTVGVTDRVEMSFELPAAWHGGGGMDWLITGFHDLFGVVANERDDASRNGFRFELHDADGSDWIADSGEKGAFFEDPFVRLSFLVAEGAGRAPRTSLDLHLRLGGGRAEEFMAGAGPELALGVTLAEDWGRWHAYLGIARVFVAADEFGGVEVADRRTEGFLAVELELPNGSSLVVQALLSSGFAEDFRVYANTVLEFHAGLKWHASPRTALELGIVENAYNYDSSPDLGFHFGVTRRF